MKTAVLAVALALIIAACNASASQPGGLSAASSGVCDAISVLPDASLAERAFTNRAHDALHTLAGDPRLDRALAADLLEAMLRVEEDIARSADARALGGGLAALHVAADAALAALGEDVPACDS
ncbi:MAG TPA: hypothetical protein VK838_00860 [Candidatus Limnocylindrales bacterium]|nr:hypothetical protein [Candidatus Limnocylindrales bacterium]